MFRFAGYTVARWMPVHRQPVVDIVQSCLESYGLRFESEGADRDAIEVERFYHRDARGEFWVVLDEGGKVVGSIGYHKLDDQQTVEIRKMYLLPEARGKKLGRKLLEVE